MVLLSDIQASNASLPAYYPTRPVAVFEGATAGIGKAALSEFLRRTPEPKVYIIGRNEASRQEWLAELNASNTKATIVFLEADMTLIKEAKRIGDLIAEKEQKIDLLNMSAGFISLSGRRETAEGLASSNALAYWTRITLTLSLLPLLRASQIARVVSILDSRLLLQPSKLILDDLDLKKPENYSMLQCAKHTTTMTTLVFDKLASENPGVSFLHTHPGGVVTATTMTTGIGSGKQLFGESYGSWGGKWVWPYFMNYVILPLLSFQPYWMSEEVSGERGVFNATSASFLTEGQMASLEEDGRSVASGRNSSVSSGKNGVILVTWDCETAPSRELLRQLQATGADKAVWEATVQQIEDSTRTP